MDGLKGKNRNGFLSNLLINKEHSLSIPVAIATQYTTTRPATRRCVTRNHTHLILSAVFALSVATARQAYGGSDFLVVENANRLQIYNKYQQEATRQELQMFAPFVPMRILKANDLMGDGFAQCMQIEVDGQVFYLLKDKDGRLIHSGPLGFEETFRHATIILDTAQILTDKSVLFKPIGSPASNLSASMAVIRVFRHQGSTYCRTVSSTPVFGWVDFSAKGEGRSWRVLKHLSSVNASISSLIVQRVRARMSDVNHVLVRLFDLFNGRTNKRKQPPQWSVEASGKTILCTLRGADNPDNFEQSTFYLVNEIENVVLGSEFEVAHSPGRIEIRHK